MESTNKKTTRNIFIAVIALLLMVAVFFTAYQLLRQKGTEGAKTIHVNVIVGGATIHSADIHTDAEYLRQALDEASLIDGDESVYGFWVTSVAGRVADGGKEEWWSLYKNGEFSMTGVDDTPIEDGDSIEYKLIVGYDESGF
jgi:hypothetical protein